MPSDRRDESVQFSLTELAKLEEERLLREKTDRIAAEAAAEAEKHAAARREREERERREAEERERERRLRFEREARLEAMSRAAVEQARIAVETSARAEEAERERRHELELARLRADAGRPFGAGMLAVSAAVGVTLGLVAAFVVYSSMIEPKNAKLVAELRLGTSRTEADLLEARRENLALGGQLADLRKQLDRARRDVPLRDHEGKSSGAKVKEPPRTPLNVENGDRHRDPLSGVCAGSRDPLCGLDLRGK